MKESYQIYKPFENKKILLVTKSGFRYHTSNLRVLDTCVSFTDNRGLQTVLAFEEIRFCQEVEE